MTQTGSGVMRSMAPFLFQDSCGYTTDESAKLSGDIGFVSDIFMIASDLIVGYIFDKFGRKYLSITCLFICGVALILYALSNCWVVGYYLTRVTFQVCMLPAENSPLSFDYLPK